MTRVLEFISIVLVAVILIPSGAHFFELPNKIALIPENYFVVQNIYRGWAMFGIVIFAALAAVALLAWQWRLDILASRLAWIAFLCIAASLAVFFVWVYPANVATANWTAIPENWMTLRRDWEFGHAASALLTFAAFYTLVLASVFRR